MKVAALLALVLLAACKDPKVAAEEAEAGAAPVASPGAAPSTTAVASATKPSACTSDGDCTTHSSYCADTPCACQVLTKGEAAPKCSGAPVNCFVDPCMRKAAACQSGACVLVTKSN